MLLVLGLCRPAWAVNICDEAVPSNRIVDGIPAYAQCTDSESGSIYSNNGIDTTTTATGSDWVRTQRSGGYQCTELAHRYLHFKWNVQSVPSGNAGVWCDGTIPSGLEKTTIPVHGDLIVFAPGSCGADPTTGHVAVVDVVNSNGSVTFVEQNRAGRRSCAIDTAACFLHALANDGTTVDGGIADSASLDTAVDSATTNRPEAGERSDSGSDARRTDTSGSGGAAGAGGASGTGGRVASGGAPGTGGVRASGGASAVANNGGSGGTTSSSEPMASPSSGCACRVSDGSSGDFGSRLGALVFLALLLASRRPRRGR